MFIKLTPTYQPYGSSTWMKSPKILVNVNNILTIEPLYSEHSVIVFGNNLSQRVFETIEEIIELINKEKQNNLISF